MKEKKKNPRLRRISMMCFSARSFEMTIAGDSQETENDPGNDRRDWQKCAVTEIYVSQHSVLHACTKQIAGVTHIKGEHR